MIKDVKALSAPNILYDVNVLPYKEKVCGIKEFSGLRSCIETIVHSFIKTNLLSQLRTTVGKPSSSAASSTTKAILI